MKTKGRLPSNSREEQKKQYITGINPLENIYFLCNHKGPVYRFFEKEEHANALARGDVYLSTLERCRSYEDAEQGDSEEASETYLSGSLFGSGDNPQFVEKARRAGMSVSVDSRNILLNNNSSKKTLLDAYLLCTTTEFLPENLNDKFGKYCVEIKDPRIFFIAISNKINLISTIRQGATRQIIYADRSCTGLDETPGPIGFVKPKFPYENQKEFRFLWAMEKLERLEPLLVECPEISYLCRRVDKN